MNYAEIKYNDIANGPGVRTSLFVSGCTHHCKECFNSCTWDFGYGKAYTKETEDTIIKSLEPEHIKGLTILGGEPMEPVNQKEIVKLIKRIRKEMPDISIWVYSGYTYEELSDGSNARCHGEHTREILDDIDVLVDGEFMEDKKDITLKFRGSSNQRLIDMKKSRKENKIILYL